MRILMWSLLGFVAGAVLGLLLTFFGWVAYAAVAKVAYSDGAMVMGVAFVAAPLVGLTAGLIGAFLLALRAARRQERLDERRAAAFSGERGAASPHAMPRIETLDQVRVRPQRSRI